MRRSPPLFGIRIHSLHGYCNQGLVPNVKCDARNRRVFDDHDLTWIKDQSCLKRCGFSIKGMKRYLDLCLQGPGTIPQRQKMFEGQRAVLADRIAQLNDSLEYIDWKQSFYRDVLAGKCEYRSNLIDPTSLER